MYRQMFAVFVAAASGSIGVRSASASIAYSAAGTVYTENFNSLASSGTTAAFANNSTVAGLYAFYSGASNAGTGRVSGNVDNVTPASWLTPATYVPFTTSTTGSRLNAYGSSGSNDRAIGSLAGSTATASPGDWFFGFVFQNTTGSALDAFTLAYTGEQWVQAATPLTVPQRLRFDYLVTPSFDPATANNVIATQSNFGSYTPVSALDFVSLQNSATTASAIDGNASANRTALSQTVSASIPAGSYVVLRFFDDDDNGNDNGLGIDDLTFSATTAVPEPASVTLLAVAGAAIARRRRV